MSLKKRLSTGSSTIKSALHDIPRGALALCVLLALLTFSGIALMLGSVSLEDESRTSTIYPDEHERSAATAIPIFLYHNIDGAGSFSVSLQQLESHFAYLKEKGVRILSFDELINIQQGRDEVAPGKGAVISFDDGYLSAYTKLLPLVEKFGYKVTLFVYTDFIEKHATSKLTWQKLRTLESKGFDIQCHTISHADLTALNVSERPLAQALYHELYFSKKIIEMHLKKKVDYIAYPYGHYSVGLLELTKKSGYSHALSTDYGAHYSFDQNFCFARHHIKRDFTLEDLEKILAMK